MSGILIPCLSDAALPEFISLCIWSQNVKGPSDVWFNEGTHNYTNDYVFNYVSSNQD